MVRSRLTRSKPLGSRGVEQTPREQQQARSEATIASDSLSGRDQKQNMAQSLSFQLDDNVNVILRNIMTFRYILESSMRV